MPVRAKAEEWLSRQFIGGQGFMHGEVFTMPKDDYEAVQDYVSDLYVGLVEYIDWPRVLLEARGRCSAYEHEHDFDERGACAESVEKALLCPDRPWYGENGAWKEADAVSNVRRGPQPQRWHMPKELTPMFAAFVRACRKSKRAKLEEEAARDAV